MIDPAPALSEQWRMPASTSDLIDRGRALRGRMPRKTLARLEVPSARDPLGILTEQNRTRVQDLVPLRNERMGASPFAFYRGTAAIMAADLANADHSGIVVPSCGDAHVSNFGFYASPQRTLVFDLNDFDEAAWAPWEWDLKRLVASIVIAGQASSRDATSIATAVIGSVQSYARVLRRGTRKTPVERYFASYDPQDRLDQRDLASQEVLRKALKQARKRTGERAARRLTATEDNGRLVFVRQPPTMIQLEPEAEAQTRNYLEQYLDSTNADVRQLMIHYVISDVVRRVVGVGSVGTRCSLALLQDGDGNALIMQSKEAGRSVLEQYGAVPQPPELSRFVAERGEGARVVALQRILQAFSDPFLGYLRGEKADLYIRQFHDMKGGIETEGVEDAPFTAYAQACGATLARAHSQSRVSAMISGYVGGGRRLGEALLEWGHAYASLSRRDYESFLGHTHSHFEPLAD